IALVAGAPPVLVPPFIGLRIAAARAAAIEVRLPGGVPLPSRRGFKDPAVEPFADGHAGTVCCFARRITRLRPNPAHLPRQTSFHARIRRTRGGRSRMALANQGSLTGNGTRCGPVSSDVSFYRSG